MKLGLKLWSNNTDNYLKEAKRLYGDGWFDYIELYVMPNTLETIEKWSKLNIPFTLHAPHFVQGVNLSDKTKEESNLEIFKQVNEFFMALNASYIVVHSGMEGTIDEAIRQLKNITSHLSSVTSHYIIENKPYIAPLKQEMICRGAIFEEIKKVIDETGCGFCLDVGHAICTANSLKIEPFSYLKKFNDLNPACYHLSDNFTDSEIDGHMHLGKGNYDFKKIFEIINADKNIAIETNKISKIDLDDFIEDVKWLKNL